MKNPSNLIHRYQQLPLLLAVLIATPIVFFQAFRYSFPLGYAGMFTQIAGQIAEAGFRLPMSIPHYGPGGIPLIYPPFAMYVFALGTKLGISTWFYLRFAPAFFTLLALVAFYFFTAEVVGSRVAGMAAVILIISQPAVYYTHVWSAGVVRAPALFFCMAGLYFYLKALRQFSWSSFFLAGIFLGLTVTTHWLYVLFAALVGLACLIAEWKASRFPVALGILVVALLVAAPWLILVLERHRLASVLMATSSHRNVDFFTSTGTLRQAVQFIAGNLGYVTDNLFLTLLAIPGCILLLLQRKFHIPLAFLFILFMGEASFYSEILAGIMAGFCIAEIIRRMPRLDGLKRPGPPQLAWLVVAAAGLLCITLASLDGLKQIAQYQPEINGQSLKMADFVRRNTDPDATYLFIGKVNEAEWFPYLFDRTPVFAQWGSEWKGEYARQSEILVALRGCQLEKSWPCMEAIQQENSVSPDLLVIPNKRWLVQAVTDTKAWDRIYKDDLYLVWKKKG
jgi:4-amino-4-deoxy-L-arabinose transferase-like glycosyltransferase